LKILLIYYLDST